LPETTTFYTRRYYFTRISILQSCLFKVSYYIHMWWLEI
jgi:hypothetical protein